MNSSSVGDPPKSQPRTGHTREPDPTHSKLKHATTRSAPTTTAAALRAESMLDVALLKTARSSIILAAAAHDGGGEGAIDTEGANDLEAISP